MTAPNTRWPARLWIVRHGESAGNVARDAAQASGAERIAIEGRDVDVPLSPRGEEQAAALGRWFAHQPADARPDVLLSSPYVRAQHTARLFRDHGGCDAQEPICSDERLREKEFGILDGLTVAGIVATQAQQAEFRRLLGKFYHRPPGGESWCDVIFRLRSVMDTVSLHHAGGRVMIVAHQVVVLCLRYIIEGLDEAQILAIDRAGDVANCGVTEYRYDPAAGRDGGLVLARYNATAPIEREDADVTVEADTQVAARG
ncbi:MAG TPA: histidine phosphatase family protein [Sphingomonas sp.]